MRLGSLYAQSVGGPFEQPDTTRVIPAANIASRVVAVAPRFRSALVIEVRMMRHGALSQEVAHGFGPQPHSLPTASLLTVMTQHYPSGQVHREKRQHPPERRRSSRPRVRGRSRKAVSNHRRRIDAQGHGSAPRSVPCRDVSSTPPRPRACPRSGDQLSRRLQACESPSARIQTTPSGIPPAKECPIAGRPAPQGTRPPPPECAVSWASHGLVLNLRRCCPPHPCDSEMRIVVRPTVPP